MQPLLCPSHTIFASLYQGPGCKSCYVTVALWSLQFKPSLFPKDGIMFGSSVTDISEVDGDYLTKR